MRCSASVKYGVQKTDGGPVRPDEAMTADNVQVLTARCEHEQGHEGDHFAHLAGYVEHEWPRMVPAGTDGQ